MNSSTPGRPFGVKLLLHSTVDGAPESPGHFELSTRIIRAESEEEARVIGEEFGRKAEQSYLNADGETVRWHFDQVLAVFEIMDPLEGQGVEVFSEMRSVSEFFQWTDSWRSDTPGRT